MYITSFRKSFGVLEKRFFFRYDKERVYWGAEDCGLVRSGYFGGDNHFERYVMVLSVFACGYYTIAVSTVYCDVGVFLFKYHMIIKLLIISSKRIYS